MNPHRSALRFPGRFASLLCLVAGAAAAWTVAWSFAALSDPFDSSASQTTASWSGRSAGLTGESSDRRWELWRLVSFDSPGSTAWFSLRQRYPFEWSAHHTSSTKPSPTELAPAWGQFDQVAWSCPAADFEDYRYQWGHEYRILYSFGWAWRCLWTEAIWDEAQKIAICDGGLDVLLRPYTVTPLSTHPRLLPIRPLWLGLIGNTFLYALILWLTVWLALCQIPHTLCRAARRRTHRCLACGYNLFHAGATCPECGQPNQRAHTAP